MRFVVMDLEWNQSINTYVAESNGIRLHGEIVQIGAVKLNEKLEITDKYSELIKPVHYKKMQQGVVDLTEITDEMVQEGRPFPEVAEEFLTWGTADIAFATWSQNDIIMLEDNMLFYGMDIDDLPVCYDMQIVFDDQVMMDGRDYSLSYAMWKFDEKPERSHDALNDAINTAKVMRNLDLDVDLTDYEV